MPKKYAEISGYKLKFRQSMLNFRPFAESARPIKCSKFIGLWIRGKPYLLSLLVTNGRWL